MKKVLTLILAMAMALSLAACGKAGTASSPSASPAASASPSSSASPAATYVVGFSNVDDIYSYCAKFRDYLVADCKELGINVIVTNAGGDANVMNGQVEDMISQNAKIISTIACNPDGNTPALQSAKTAKLPYVAFLNSIKGGDDYPGYIYIGSQNYDAGTMQGKYLADKLPQNAKVIYLTGSLSNQENLDRKKGMMDALKSRTDIKFIAEYDVDAKKDRAMSTTEDCLQAFSSFDAIVCQNDDSALGAVEALKAGNRLKGVMTVGIDGSDAALKSIQDGELTMSVLQDAKSQAKAGADVFAKIRDGADPATIKDIYVPFQVITKDNVADFIGK